MDTGVVSGLLQLVTQGRLLAEKTSLLKSVASKRPATASGCGGAGPSAAASLLSDAPGIALVAAPCIRPRGARNATHTLFQQPARRPSGNRGCRGRASLGRGSRDGSTCSQSGSPAGSRSPYHWIRAPPAPLPILPP